MSTDRIAACHDKKIGTPAFMAPEQARCETQTLDARADVYALGATLYSALAGRPPFVGSATDILVGVILNDPPRLRTLDPMIPPALETIVEKCLEKDAARRYDSALALAADLGRYLEGAPIVARPRGLWRRTLRLLQRHKLLVASVTTALLMTLLLGGLALRIRWQAAEQARLAQHLGQEIAKMEWLLRSARQLPLHDLTREKDIVRRRMRQLHAELTSYGSRSQGLVHYALGRGHMALHEYPEALAELRQAMQLGIQGAELDYALGLVLGKHFEQAIYEARLSGGGDWANRQLKDLEPKYLTPAIASLVRSRSAKLDAPQYLEGLISYYQRDYDAALAQAAAASRDASWLYEATKLAGDIHLDRALRAEGSGHYDEAESEFAESVRSYEAAAAVGQSDSEVYEGLAESWIRQIEMKASRGQTTATEYAAARSASDKIMAAEPSSVNGLLKQALAAAMERGPFSTVLGTAERIQQCRSAADQALQRQPENPYAGEVAACCYMLEAEVTKARGESPEPLLRKAQSILESTVVRHPHFLWAINDLGVVRLLLAGYLQVHGQPEAKGLYWKALEQYVAAIELDPTYAIAPQNSLAGLAGLVAESRSEAETVAILARADAELAKCAAINRQQQQCVSNYFQVYARAADQALLAGQSPQPRLMRALAILADLHRLGGSFLDAEQHAALAHLVQAADAVKDGREPSAALSELRADLTRCFALAAQDAMCRTLAARAQWVDGEWLSRQHKSAVPSLEAALAKALLATQSPETYPDAWQTLAEAHLRLARSEKVQPAVREQHATAGLAAAAKALSINPNHALGLATQGALYLVRAQQESTLPTRQSLAQAAVQALERALKLDPFLAKTYTPLLGVANALLAG